MDWTLVDPVEDPQALEIQTQLKDLGYPAEALADLTQEDLLACEGAWLVVVEEADLPVNEGRTVTYDEYGITRTERVYDTRELHLTTVAVRLPEQGQAWRVFHHFRFTTSPGFPGTEAVEIFADTMGTWGWLPRSERQGTGRLLYDRQGQTYTTSYTTLEWVEENGNTFLRGTFSLPENGTNQRGYLAYEVDAVYFERSTRLFSHLTYAHQTGRLRFLHRTALDYINASILGRSGPFVTAEGGIDLLSTPEGAE